MVKGLRAAIVLLMALAACVVASPGAFAADDPENTLYLDLTYGRVVIRMRPDLAPKHVARVKHLAREGFYDGLTFHRVIAGFMAQTGDPKGDGTGGSGRTLDPEFTSTPQVRGAVSMARADKKDSADSQFFIVLTDANRGALDSKYTMWGEVTSGMEFVDKIKKGDANKNGTVASPDKIVRLQVAADADQPMNAVAADLLKTPAAAEAARNFSGAEFKCPAVGYGTTVHTTLARLWAHGFMSGYYKAKGKLVFVSDDNGMDSSLHDVCKTYPQAFLITVAAQDLVRATRDMPDNTPAFSPAKYTCKDYTAARSANTPEADFVDLWAMAFIQGYKDLRQPDLEIPFSARPQILGALGSACAKNTTMGFAELTAALAAKMKLQ